MSLYGPMWTKNIDKVTLILQVLYELFQKNNITTIRRTDLKERCNDRLIHLTRGEQEDYGGSFQRHLKALEKQKLLTCIRKGKKETVIIPMMQKIEYYLEDKKLNESFNTKDKKIIEYSPEDSIWEEFVVEAYRTKLDKAIKQKYNLDPDCFEVNSTEQRSYVLIKETIAKSMANMMSRVFEFKVSYPDDKNFQVDRYFYNTLVEAIIKVIQRNPEAPFKIEFDFKGIPIEHAEDINAVHGPSFFRLVSEFFVEWADQIHNYKVSEEDKTKITQGQSNLLEKPTSEYFAIFNQSITEYTELLRSVKPQQIFS